MKWEYFVKDLYPERISPEGQMAILNHFGKQGYELVSVDNSLAYFKRPTEKQSLEKFTYEAVQDGYVIFGPDGKRLNAWDIVNILEQKK